MNNFPRLSIALLSITLIVLTSSLIISLTPRNPAPPTSAWQNYSNPDFSFQYPPGWQAKTTMLQGMGSTQEIVSPDGLYLLTFSSRGNYNQTTSQPYSSLDEYIGLPYKVDSVAIDGQEGRKPLPRAGSENIHSADFFSKDRKFIYTLTLHIGDSPFDKRITQQVAQAGQELFSRILSTFKFLPENSNYVSFSKILENSQTYSGKRVCAEGYYYDAFETMSFSGESPTNRIGKLSAWVINNSNQNILEKIVTSRLGASRKIAACGTFSTGSKYGHLGFYDHQFEIDQFTPLGETVVYQ